MKKCKFGAISLGMGILSILCNVQIVMMAIESGVPADKVGLAKTIAVIGIILGVGGIATAITGLVKEEPKALPIIGIVVSGLSFFLAVLFSMA